MPTPVSVWTAFPELFDRLKKLAMDGLSTGGIAAELGHGITRNAVIGKISRNKIPRPEKPVQERAKRKRQRIHISSCYGNPIIPFVEKYVEPPEAIDDKAIPVEQRKTLLQLTKHTCRWPVGEVGEPDFFFCGGITKDDLPYCAKHAHRAYNVVREPRPTKFHFQPFNR